MEAENEKLKKIKNSCHIAGIFSKIIFIVGIVATTLTLISGIVIIANKSELNTKFQNYFESDKKDLKISQNIGGLQIHLLDINPRSFINKDNIKNIDSSIPAVKEALNSSPYSYSIAFMLLMISLMLAAFTFSMYQLVSVFSLIQKEETPFSEKVLKKLLVALIIISVAVGITLGIGFGALSGLITWAIYSIMDYGRVLQIQSDETL